MIWRKASDGLPVAGELSSLSIRYLRWIDTKESFRIRSIGEHGDFYYWEEGDKKHRYFNDVIDKIEWLDESEGEA